MGYDGYRLQSGTPMRNKDREVGNVPTSASPNGAEF